MVRSPTWLLLVLLAACGGDSDGDASGGSIDAPTSDIDGGGGVVDGATADLPSSLGDLCATTAPDGSPAACTGGTVCCAGTSGTFCRLPDECSTGTGFVACTGLADCFSGRICCSIPGMQFCAKPDSCAAYGGTEVP